MLISSIFESKANKQVRRFLIHCATETSIDINTAQFVLNLIAGKIAISLYAGNGFIATIPIKNVCEFFGSAYDENNSYLLYGYFVRLSIENSMELADINIRICENQDKMGAHLYAKKAYIKSLPTLEILNHFISDK